MMKEKALRNLTPISYRIVCSVLFSVSFFLSLPQGLVGKAQVPRVQLYFLGVSVDYVFFLAILYSQYCTSHSIPLS
ncbi:hypothetical protein F5051DRAFT_422219 [Lentinula edodes]|nr:hypothetical protein F5051DRAFT_422219 [Lentinula edodes]